MTALGAPSLGVGRLALAAGTLVVLLAEAWAHRGGRTAGAAGARVRDRLLVAAGLAALVIHVDPRALVSSSYVHAWDAFHHVVGAKYFDELGYDGLYECVTVADAEEPGAAAAVAARVVTDLRTGEPVSARDIVAAPERCRRRFAPERWEAFRRDVALFRAHVRPRDWQWLTADHGFNASPAWLLVAHPLVAGGELDWARVHRLTLLDPALLALALALVAWAFGARTAALVAIVLCAYFPAGSWWTRGSFLRWDWLAALLAGLAWCRRGRPVAGGAALAYAALSRVFPGFALVGVALAVLAGALRRRVPADGARILAGAALAAALLAPAAELARPGPTWAAFARDLERHGGVPSPNRMGVSTLLAFDRATSLARLEEAPVAPARAVWQHARAADIGRHRWAWAALAALAALAVALAARGQPGWCAAALGLALVPVGPALACYYYACLAALACLATRRDEVAIVLLGGVTAAGVAAGLDRYLVDAQYAAQSLLAIVALAFIVSAFLGRRRPREDQFPLEPGGASEASRASTGASEAASLVG